ncbi:MAG: Clp protease N-terminal domain-containing protein [Armatimonadota bacterium]
MWQYFTEGTKKAIIRAQRAANDRSENIVKPEHLLIGLLSETHTDAYLLLQEAGVVVDDLVSHLESILTPGPGRDNSDLRLDPSAKKAIDLAWMEARRLHRNYIGTEHLILGILAADTGATGITFRHFSLDLEKGRYLVETVEDVYPDVSLGDAAEAGPVVAARQTETDGLELLGYRKGPMPGLIFAVVFIVLIMALRGCG